MKRWQKQSATKVAKEWSEGKHKVHQKQQKSETRQKQVKKKHPPHMFGCSLGDVYTLLSQ